MKFEMKQLGWRKTAFRPGRPDWSLYRTTDEARPCLSRYGHSVGSSFSATHGLPYPTGVCVARLSSGTAAGPHKHPAASCC